MKHLYIGQINSTELKIDEIIKKCNSIYDSIYPNIGETSFMEQCNNLLSKNIDLLTNANASENLVITFDEKEKTRQTLKHKKKNPDYQIGSHFWYR